MILLKIDEYCSADVADISSKANSLFTIHSNKPLHEYPEIKKYQNKSFKTNSGGTYRTLNC